MSSGIENLNSTNQLKRCILLRPKTHITLWNYQSFTAKPPFADRLAIVSNHHSEYHERQHSIQPSVTRSTSLKSRYGGRDVKNASYFVLFHGAWSDSHCRVLPEWPVLSLMLLVINHVAADKFRLSTVQQDDTMQLLRNETSTSFETEVTRICASA